MKWNTSKMNNAKIFFHALFDKYIYIYVISNLMIIIINFTRYFRLINDKNVNDKLLYFDIFYCFVPFILKNVFYL